MSRTPLCHYGLQHYDLTTSQPLASYLTTTLFHRTLAVCTLSDYR